MKQENVLNLRLRLIVALSKFTRRLHPRGTERILRLLYHPHDTRDKETERIRIAMKYDHDLLFNVDTSMFVGWRTLFFGDYEPHITGVIKRFLRPGSIALDVGANVGIHTIMMAKTVGAKGKVIAVEPLPENIDRLRENIALNGFRNTEIVQAALSDKRSRSPLYFLDDSSADRGGSTFYRDNNPARLTKEIPVDVRTLDEIAGNLAKVDLIKIDTEGNDFKVLLGSAETLSKFRPTVVFEYERHFWDNAGCSLKMAEDFFSSRGYLLQAINGRGIQPLRSDLVSSDILAIHPSSGSR